MEKDIKMKKNNGKVHLANPYSSVTNCGWWINANAFRYKVKETTPVTCQKCNPSR